MNKDTHHSGSYRQPFRRLEENGTGGKNNLAEEASPEQRFPTACRRPPRSEQKLRLGMFRNVSESDRIMLHLLNLVIISPGFKFVFLNFAFLVIHLYCILQK